METKNENGNKPAFPLVYDGSAGPAFCYDGLTKREYIATKLLASIMLGYDLMSAEERKKSIEYLMQTYGYNIKIGEALTKNALAFTDELLKHLDK